MFAPKKCGQFCCLGQRFWDCVQECPKGSMKYSNRPLRTKSQATEPCVIPAGAPAFRLCNLGIQYRSLKKSFWLLMQVFSSFLHRGRPQTAVYLNFIVWLLAESFLLMCTWSLRPWDVLGVLRDSPVYWFPLSILLVTIICIYEDSWVNSIIRAINSSKTII